MWTQFLGWVPVTAVKNALFSLNYGEYFAQKHCSALEFYLFYLVENNITYL